MVNWLGRRIFTSKNPQGTEVKAITFSVIQVYNEEKPEIFVIIDTYDTEKKKTPMKRVQ
jgi:hypothetical protein